MEATTKRENPEVPRSFESGVSTLPIRIDNRKEVSMTERLVR